MNSFCFCFFVCVQWPRAGCAPRARFCLYLRVTHSRRVDVNVGLVRRRRRAASGRLSSGNSKPRFCHLQPQFRIGDWGSDGAPRSFSFPTLRNQGSPVLLALLVLFIREGALGCRYRFDGRRLFLLRDSSGTMFLERSFIMSIIT